MTKEEALEHALVMVTDYLNECWNSAAFYNLFGDLPEDLQPMKKDAVAIKVLYDVVTGKSMVDELRSRGVPI